MGLEHHLGMTCDPVCGLVQIPCIERNAYAAARALDANLYSAFTDGGHRVSFDRVVEVMKQTGHDLPSIYKGVRSRQVTMQGGTLDRVPPCCLVRKNQSFPGKYFMYCTRWKNSESLLPKPSRPLNSSSAVMP